MRSCSTGTLGKIAIFVVMIKPGMGGYEQELQESEAEDMSTATADTLARMEHAGFLPPARE